MNERVKLVIDVRLNLSWHITWWSIGVTALLPYGRVLDLAPQYRRETNNYKTADISARGRVRAAEKKEL